MIEIRNLKKSFAGKPILFGINLDINISETLCIIGKSGCGKSVLLKNIVGLLLPDDGYISIDGHKISNLKQKDLFDIRKTIGYVFQGAALFDSYNVFENIVIKLTENNSHIPKAELISQAKFVLSAVGLLPSIEEFETSHFQNEWNVLANKKPSELSGGMKKRVGVARALIGNPKYIFYDEPTTGLDPVTSKQIDDLILELSNKLNVTSIVITHDMFSVYNVADKVAMLHNGNLHYYGTPDNIKISTDPVVVEFISRYQ